ncbi:MAG: RNA polymerase sigma factor [Verrucomicrobiales bacterium]
MDESAEPEAWRQWFRDHGSRLLLFSRQQTRTQADAEDVLQEAIVRLWRTAGCAPDSPPPSLPLAYTSIRHTAIDLARRNIRRTKREQKSEYVVDDSSESTDWFGTASLEEKERNAVIAEAIKDLPEKFREVLTLKIWGDLTFAQIADTLNIPMNTAASRYRYALEALRKSVKPSSF